MEINIRETGAITAAANKAAGDGVEPRVRFNTELTDFANRGQETAKHVVILTDRANNDVITGRIPVCNLSNLATWSDTVLFSNHSTTKREIEAAMLHLMKNPVFDAVSSQDANRSVTNADNLQVVFSDPAVGVKFQMSADRLLTDLSVQNSPFKPVETEKALQYLVVADAAIAKTGFMHTKTHANHGAEAELTVNVMTRAGLPVVVRESELLQMSGWDAEQFAHSHFKPDAIEAGLRALQLKTFDQPSVALDLK